MNHTAFQRAGFCAFLPVDQRIAIFQTMSTSRIEFVEIEAAGNRLKIEHQWIASERVNRPLLIFLHEGLGSLAMWKDFPLRLCYAVQLRGLVYSRPGYGRSTPRAPHEHWQIDFMHRQAHDVLPALRDALHITEPAWLFGHSDGGSIALLHAARFPQAVGGAIVLAPHIRVEAFGLRSIRAARVAYETSDLRARLARYHDEVDSAFFGWNDIWLDPAFERWTIEAELAAIRCPLLAVQGVDDRYGTLEQVRGIARRVLQTELLALPDCGHSPHRDQPERLIDAVCSFFDRHA